MPEKSFYLRVQAKNRQKFNPMQQSFEEGFLILNNIFTEQEVSRVINRIDDTKSSNEEFRKTNELFAIRQFLKAVPDISRLIFNDTLKEIIKKYFGPDYFVIKSIYFDKPPAANWFVAWHQDLTISVDKKLELEGFNHWTTKHGQFAVQPPLDLLKNIFTIRIHLDDTDESNGALKILPGSHKKGVFRIEGSEEEKMKSITCNVKRGGLMIMRPLLFHSSQRTNNHNRRRVIHIEFCNKPLPEGLNWAEAFNPFILPHSHSI